MKTLMIKILGKSWKTTFVGYLLAISLAVQPLLDVSVDLTKRIEVIKYVLRLIFAAGVALLGKYAADSVQVKELSGTVKHLSEPKSD